MQELEILFGDKRKQFCKECENYIIDGKYALCDMDHFPKTSLNKAQIYIAVLFDCEDYAKCE